MPLATISKGKVVRANRTMISETFHGTQAVVVWGSNEGVLVCDGVFQVLQHRMCHGLEGKRWCKTMSISLGDILSAAR